MLAVIQQSVTQLLATREPTFLAFGHRLFLAFAVIMIAGQGIRTMLSGASFNESIFEFAKLLLFISFGYALIAFYESPIPGVGVSFSNLITDQAAYFANVLEQDSLEAMYSHLDELWSRFMLPNIWAILPNLLYWVLLILVQIVKALTMAVVAGGLIASAVCGLVGPIFVPFLIVSHLDFLFWGWFKAFLQYSFIQVIAMAYIMVFERFIFAFVATIPPVVTTDQFLLYLVQSVVVLITMALGIVTIPFLTSSIFSGHAHHSSGGGLMSMFARLGR